MKSLFIALALAVSLSATANPLPREPHIYVEGSADVEVAPDVAFLSVLIEESRSSAEEAKRVVDERSRKLIALSKELGVTGTDISTSGFNIAPHYDYVDGRSVYRGTTVSRTIDLTLNNLESYPALLKALIDSGVSRTLTHELDVKNREEVLSQARVKAMDDARQKAQMLARSQKVKLGGVHSISEFNLRQDEVHKLYPSATMGGAGKLGNAAVEYDRSRAEEPFLPGLLVVKAQMYVVYYLKKR